ncbi:YeiH family protein [Cohnella caldifontis]|uniref:YeiH family protein n=1 Tax=Cohnella caldifontis TaxID=3027471 RepID=UPI0023EDB273|nr:putative sulfate exporter family transporter [Cohnella sp. YIM B05605]
MLRTDWIGGVMFTLGLASVGWGMAWLPGLDHLGPLADALLAAALYRRFFGFPDRLRTGIRLSSGSLLRLAVALYGLRLNVSVLIGGGLMALAQGALTIAFAWLVVTALGRRWKADAPLTLLLALGTGICGAAAVAAVSPILRSKEEDAAVSAGLIALTGTLFAVGYTLLQPWLPLDPAGYGIWAGASLHEVAHVAMAAAPAGSEAMADALLYKLARVLLLVPVCLILLRLRNPGRRRDGFGAGVRGAVAGGAVRGDDSDRSRIAVPWFLLGFVATSLLGSYAFPAVGIDPEPIAQWTSKATTLLLGMAMGGLGLHVNLQDLRSRAVRPLGALFVGSLLLSALTYGIVLATQ